MKVYYKEAQFPEADKYCRVNPSLTLNHLIEYIPSDENKIIVGEDAGDQRDFDAFFDEPAHYIAYIMDKIMEETSQNYIAILEEMGNEDIPKMLFLRTFKIEGVDWITADMHI